MPKGWGIQLNPGQDLGHYRIERLIGQGGMGAVYLAEDTTLGRKVAIKVLPAEMSASADQLERFRREAKAVAALNHPSIVTIHSVESAGETQFITMELVEGESLDRAISPGGMPLARVFDIGIAIADALAAAHERGIVHRDLKPANVMLAKDGRVKVLDFGLAKLTAESGPAAAMELTSAPTEIGNTPLTGVGQIVGTVPYMSPEQINGRTVDARSDIFSLGVILHELATGRRPFRGETPAETISSILRDAPAQVTESRQDAPRHLARIVDHCLQKDPEARFQTAKDVRNELRALRKEMESGASEAVVPLVAMKRTPRWIWVAGLAVLAGVAAAVLWQTRGSRAPAAVAAVAVLPAKSAINSLAVLPFVDMSSSKDQEYFSDGLTEELLNVLARIPGLKVIARTSSFAFKGKNEDLRIIAGKLGVDHILEGSVRKSGDKVRITAQLVNAADGFHLWSETYDRTLNDIFAVQDDIAKSVAQSLRVTLLNEGKPAKKPNAEAYDLVLQARFVMQSSTPESVRQGRALLARALELSPDYAPIWAEMGLAEIREGELATKAEDKRRASERGEKALRRALELDPELAVAHSRLAGVQQARWDFAGAERSISRALAVDPGSAIVLANAAFLTAKLGKINEAISLQERVSEADPLSAGGHVNLSLFYSTAGRFDEAEAQCRKAIELRADNANAYGSLGQILLRLGRAEEARSYFAKYNELTNAGEYGRLWNEAMLEHAAGNAAASQRAAEEFEKRFGVDDPYSCAQIRSYRGEADAAFAWLDKSLAVRDPALVELKLDNLVFHLHGDSRWNELLKKVGLPTD